jgi:uncharacterized membrane-anchored protein
LTDQAGRPLTARSLKFSLGHLTTLLLFVAVIAVIAGLWRFTGLDGVLAFWLAYIMTRPLGASTGDFLSQRGNQGLNLGTSTTSCVFLAVIVCLVAYLQVNKPDITPERARPASLRGVCPVPAGDV